ncbi:MAG TPA: HAD family phosphatase [Dehalococcoidia bacterium]|nr:HAD family phosphatase [Dehalococcoidia bacterium]
MDASAVRPRNPVRAVIFDMDGVLLDSEPLHHRAVNEILAAEGKDGLSSDEYVPYMGTTDEYTWSDLIRRFQLPEPFEHYRDRYDRTVLELYRCCSEPAPGVSTVLAEIRSRGLGLAVASSSRRAWVETCLTTLGIRDRFNIVITGDMVRLSKPNPEIYLLAARCLGVPPEACLAIEDSPKGVTAAVGAGMYTIAVASTYATEQYTSTAQMRIDSLANLDCSVFDASIGRTTSKVRNG